MEAVLMGSAEAHIPTVSPAPSSQINSLGTYAPSAPEQFVTLFPTISSTPSPPMIAFDGTLEPLPTASPESSMDVTQQLLLVAVVSAWLLLVFLGLWFVWMVEDGRKDPFRHTLSARLMLLGSIWTVFCTLQILAAILEGFWFAIAMASINCLTFTAALDTFHQLFSEVSFKSPPILSTGSFAPSHPPNTTSGKITWLRWWACIICLSPLLYIPGLPYWQDCRVLISLQILFLIVDYYGVFLGGVAAFALTVTVISPPVRWTLVSNQKHASSEHHCHVALKVECVALWNYHYNVVRAFRGSIPQERKPPAGTDESDPNHYYITNDTSERIVLETSVGGWVEMTPDDPDSFLDAITQALNQDPEHKIAPSINGVVTTGTYGYWYLWIFYILLDFTHILVSSMRRIAFSN